MTTDIQQYKLAETSMAIIDDHELVLEGFRSFMEKKGVGEVVCFRTARQLLAAIANRHFDIYIVDFELPDTEAPELIDSIRTAHPEARIIVNTIHEEIWIVGKMSEKQVDGVVYKSAPLEQLLEAVTKVLDGQQYYCRKFQNKRRQLELHDETLSQRELQVLLGIARGLLTKEIARRLYISENTVENHRRNLFRKLKAHNMVELVTKAIVANYINLDDISG